MDPDQSAWASVIRHVASSTALNPTLVLSVIATPMSLMLAAFGPQKLSFWFLGIAIAPLAVGLLQIAGFSLFNADRLQNEKHVQRMTAILHRLGTRSGEETKEIVIPSSTVLIDNPASSGGGGHV